MVQAAAPMSSTYVASSISSQALYLGGIAAPPNLRAVCASTIKAIRTICLEPCQVRLIVAATSSPSVFRALVLGGDMFRLQGMKLLRHRGADGLRTASDGTLGLICGSMQLCTSSDHLSSARMSLLKL